MIKRPCKIFTLLLGVFILASCATSPEQKPRKPIESTMPVEEQKIGAMKKFNEILSVKGSPDDKTTAMERKEKLYHELISEYPDAPLTQEAFWQLMQIYIKEYSPPAYEKAESLYELLLSTFPESVFKGLVDKELGYSYYKSEKWERLLKISSPVYKAYTESGEIPAWKPMIFMYGEANFHLGNRDAAKEAFLIVQEKFPLESLDKKVRGRLFQIRRNRY